MVYVSESLHKRKLDKENINIKTIYLEDGIELERNTNGSVDDTIKNGRRIRKEYYLNNELKEIETDFDSRLKYNFIEALNSDKKYTCKNCGMSDKLKEFDAGCPYCGTYYNLDYSSKNNKKKMYYDRLLRNKSYRMMTVMLDAFFCFITAVLIYNRAIDSIAAFEWYKLFVVIVLEAFILFFVLYRVNGLILLKPYKKYKDKENQKQRAFWAQSGLDKVAFINNFNYEVRKYYYNKKDVIDFDILDFDSVKDYYIRDDRYIEVEAYIRVVKFDDDFTSSYKRRRFTFMYNKNCLSKKRMTCYNCGSVVSKSSAKCKKCNADIKYYQEWILI